jgi:hypothetical protein
MISGWEVIPMSFVRGFAAQPALLIVGEIVLLAAILALATAATVLFSGPIAGSPFDWPIEQPPLPF